MNRFGQSARRTIALGAALLALAACGNGGNGGTGDGEANATAVPERGGTLRIAAEGEALTLNPFTALDNNSARVLAQVVEPLFRTDGEGKVVPWLATGMEASADFKSWNVQLREGVVFHNGDPMTADDVVYSLDQVRTGAGWTGMFSEIDTVKATSPTTVEIITSVPSPALEASLALPFAAITPKDLAGMTPEEFGGAPIGTGPFELEKWDRGQAITLVRNEAYWDPERPYLDEVVFVTANSDSSRAQQLRGGELDAVMSPPNPQLKGIDSAPATFVAEFALAFPNFLLINQETEVFADPRVREAIDLSIDRDSIVKAAASGYGEVGRSWFTPSLKYYDDAMEPATVDRERAESLLAEATSETGVDPSFTLQVTSGDTYQSMAAEIVKENLESVGFAVEIEQLDGSANLSEVSAGNYEASMFGITSDIVDPSEIVGFYLDLNALWTGGETTKVKELFEQAKQEPDEETRADLYAQIQQVVEEDRSLIVLDYQPWIWAMQSNVAGFALPPTGVPWLADVGFVTD